MALADSHLVHVNSLNEPSLILLKLDIIAAHLALPHSSILCERPIFKTITSLPLQTILRILVLIPKLYGNLVGCEGEQLLAQAVVLFASPLLCEELFDLGTPFDEA